VFHIRVFKEYLIYVVGQQMHTAKICLSYFIYPHASTFTRIPTKYNKLSCCI